MGNLPKLFGYEDVKVLYPNRKSFESFLSRALKKGAIVQIRKGLYGLVDSDNGGLMATKYQIACHLSDTAFLDYHAALDYLGLAEQSFVSEVRVASFSRFREAEFGGVTFCFDQATLKDGIEDRMAQEGVRIACLERILVDSVDHLEKAGGFEELSQAVALMKGLDEKKILSFLRFYDNAFLYLKVGYLLEQEYGGHLSEAFYQECLRHKREKKYYFGTKSFSGGYISKWNLIVPRNGENLPNGIF